MLAELLLQQRAHRAARRLQHPAVVLQIGELDLGQRQQRVVDAHDEGQAFIVYGPEQAFGGGGRRHAPDHHFQHAFLQLVQQPVAGIDRDFHFQQRQLLLQIEQRPRQPPG
ncbi:hypothetical protein D3C86_1906650 [compost metagenome]